MSVWCEIEGGVTFHNREKVSVRTIVNSLFGELESLIKVETTYRDNHTTKVYLRIAVSEEGIHARKLVEELVDSLKSNNCESDITASIRYLV